MLCRLLFLFLLFFLPDICLVIITAVPWTFFSPPPLKYNAEFPFCISDVCIACWLFLSLLYSLLDRVKYVVSEI